MHSREERWDMAELLYYARIKEAWGDHWNSRPRFPHSPKERRAHEHNPIAEVELALAQARAVLESLPSNTDAKSDSEGAL